MKTRPSLTELNAFAAIVRLGSFRAAADEVNLSASTLSHLVRDLENRLGLRLLNRTTRSVAPTEAGTEFFRGLNPLLGALDGVIAGVGNLREHPAGTLRINAADVGARALMRSIVPEFLRRHVDMHVDIVTEGRLVDIVAEGFDAGVRLGEAVPRDMIAVPVEGQWQFLAVASPDYLARQGTPQTPDDLAKHRCIRFRLPSGKLYRWEFERHGRELRLDVAGPMTLDDMSLMVQAAVAGLGIAFVSTDLVQTRIGAGTLVPVLSDWTPAFGGHCLYYPSHRLVPPGLRAFIEVIREHAGRHS